MAIVKNAYGVEIDFDAAVAVMDDEIREQLSDELAPCAEQEFFDAYAAAHAAKYGDADWQPAQANPIW